MTKSKRTTTKRKVADRRHDLKEPNTDQPDFIYDLVREDGRLERMCSHGIGHTVGHKDPKMLKETWIWVHGCDGCCSDYKRQGE